MQFTAWELIKLQEAWEYFREFETPVGLDGDELVAWDALSAKLYRVREQSVREHNAALRAARGQS